MRNIQRLWSRPGLVIIAGCLICTIVYGVRSSFGLFLLPMTYSAGWDRETFALAMAIQNLLWGLMMPVAGIIADRYGFALVIIGGSLVYALGIWGMGMSDSATMLYLTAGIMAGVGIAFTSFSLVATAMARVVGPDKRSLIFGIGTAATSFGQFLFAPITQFVIDGYGWANGLVMLIFSISILLPLAMFLPFTANIRGENDESETIWAAITEAARHKGYILLTLGFFVCGFHVAFIVVHYPACR